MAPSNVDRLIVFLPHSDMDSCKLSGILDHHCNSSSSSSSSQTPNAIFDDSQEDQTKIREDANSVSSVLKIQVPSSTREFKVSDAEEDPKTPTSTEHRIPETATCPLAPKKTRWVPATGKRKVPFFPVVGVPADFIVYVDAMLALNGAVYVPDIMVGDLGAGDSKRLKLLPSPAYET